MAVEAQQKGIYVGVHGGADLLLEKCRDTSVGSSGAKIACLVVASTSECISHSHYLGEKANLRKGLVTIGSLSRPLTLRVSRAVLYFSACTTNDDSRSLKRNYTGSPQPSMDILWCTCHVHAYIQNMSTE
jgi:hypothetical protein